MSEENTPEVDPAPEDQTRLFREEVFENKKDSFVGKVLIDKSMAPMVLPAFVVIVTVIGAMVAIYGSYTERIKVGGYLEPDQGLVRVLATSQGVVTSVHVEQNQTVAAEDRLIDINADIIGIDGVSTAETIRETLENSLTKLHEDLDARIALSAARQKTLDERIVGLELQKNSLASRISIQKQQTDMLQAQFNKLSDLSERRLIPVAQSTAVEQQLISSRAAQAQINEQLVRLDAELLQTQSEFGQIPTSLALEVSQVERQIADLEERMVRNELQTNITLKSPVGGTVAFLAVKEAETISPGVLVATLIPEGSVLQAHLYGPSRVANRASIGDEVRLKYEAFVYQKYGTYKGEILEISDSPISPQELPRQLAQNPTQAAEPLFRIIVKLEQGFVQKGEEITELQAGAQFEAEILLRKRALYSWVFGSLFE